MNFNPEIIYSDRKTVAIEVKSDLRVIIRAPKKLKRAELDRIITQKSAWIEKQLCRLKESCKNINVTPLTESEIKALKKQAKAVLSEKAAYYAELIGVTYRKISVRSQISRWGSCSSAGNLSFNCLLALCPDAVMDYIVIHELCHRKHMNHSENFWSEVEKICPEHNKHKKWLKENGALLIARLKAE